MISELYVCMTSGIEGPKVELSEYQTDSVLGLLDMLKDANEPWYASSTIQGIGSLGEGNYYVSLTATTGVRVLVSGYTEVHTEESKIDTYMDTVGLFAFLQPIAAKAIRDWHTNSMGIT